MAKLTSTYLACQQMQLYGRRAAIEGLRRAKRRKAWDIETYVPAQKKRCRLHKRFDQRSTTENSSDAKQYAAHGPEIDLFW